MNLCRTFGVGGAADGFRRVATGNTRTLRIRYRSNQLMARGDLLPRVNAILERLQRSGWTEDLHSNDGEQLGSMLCLQRNVLQLSCSMPVVLIESYGYTYVPVCIYSCPMLHVCNIHVCMSSFAVRSVCVCVCTYLYVIYNMMCIYTHIYIYMLPPLMYPRFVHEFHCYIYQ